MSLTEYKQLDNINLQLLQSLLKQLDPEKIYFTKNDNC